jgi:hypothetical protein
MKFSAFAAFLLAAAPSFAGVTYDFHSEATGLQQITIDGSVAVEGTSTKMSVSRGDGMMFKSGSVVLSRDGGKTIDVYDAGSKTYYELSLDQLSAFMGGALKGSGIKMDFVNPSVKVTDGGDGGTIESLPTKKSALDASIELKIDAMGQTMSSKMTMHSDLWTTDKLSAAAMNVFQQRNLQTGIEALDKLIAAQAAALNGRFPLKQVTSVHISANGQDMVTTTTAMVSNIKQTTLDASAFAPPEGYTRVDNPIDRMMKTR